MPLPDQTQTIVDVLKDPETHLPTLLNATSSVRRREDLVMRLNQMAEGLVQGQIANVAWKEAKETIGGVIRQAWHQKISDVFFYRGMYQAQAEDVQAIDRQIMAPSGIHEMGFAHTKFNRMVQKTPSVETEAPIIAMRAFFNEFMPLHAASEQLKTMIVKRQVKTEEERAADERYVPPMVDKGAEQMLKGALEQVTAKHYEAMMQMFEREYWHNLNAYIAHESKPESERRGYRYGHPGARMAGYCLETEPFSRAMSLRLDTPKIVHNLAVTEANSIRDKFLYKNMRKLASIIDGKGNLHRIEVASSDLSLSGLTGTLQVGFKDKSGFQATNSVVRSTSIRGNDFHRFPLTFHKVRMPDGTAMKNVSEETMNTVFVPHGKADNVVETEATSAPVSKALRPRR